MFSREPKSALTIYSNLLINSRDEDLNKQEKSKMNYIFLQSRTIKDRNVVVGNTCFTFNKEGLAKVAFKGASVLYDIKRICDDSDVKALIDEPEYVAPVVVLKPLVSEVAINELPDELPHFPDYPVSEDDEEIVLVEETGEVISLDTPKNKNKKTKKKE